MVEVVFVVGGDGLFQYLGLLAFVEHFGGQP
jgi:hypothetical protein